MTAGTHQDLRFAFEWLGSFCLLLPSGLLGRAATVCVSWKISCSTSAIDLIDRRRPSRIADFSKFGYTELLFPGMGVVAE